MKPLLQVVTLLSISSAFAQDDFGGRIYRGNQASQGQFPYIARISQTGANGKSTGCTGSLLSDRYVMAAAHCAEGAVSTQIILGTVNDVIFNFTGNILLYDIAQEDITIHPNRSKERFTYDLVLYRLPQSVPLDEFSNIGTIALPPKSMVNSYNNRYATAVGWGAYNDTTPIPGGLKYGRVHIESHSRCKKDVRRILGTDYVTDGQICIDRSTNQGICPGDSGGPLVHNGTDGTPMVLGVASYILGNCSTNRPNVYTFVPDNLQWISDTTGIQLN